MTHMLEEKVKAALVTAVQETLAEMAFLDVIELEKREIEAGQLLYIEFSKPLAGILYVALPVELKRMIVENIHALDWGTLSVNEIDDCLLELLNILTGSFLRNLHEKDINVQLGFPHVIFSMDELGETADFSTLYFDAEGSPFSISIALT